MRTLYVFTMVIFAAAFAAIGETSPTTTDPVGFVTVTCKANSDTYVSVPLSHAPEYVGSVSAGAIVAGYAATIRFSPNPGWNVNRFAPLWYVKFTSGVLNGRYYTVESNDSETLTFKTEGDDVTGIVAGDSISIIKYWTLGDLFPPATQQTFHLSAGTLPPKRGSTLLLPDLSGTGINLAANRRFFVTSSTNSIAGSWREDTSGYHDATNVILYPDTYFIVRHRPNVADTVFVSTGSVNTDRSTTPLATFTTTQQENSVALQRPVDNTLAESSLSTGFTASLDTLGTNRRDVLLVFDNTQGGINKSPSRTFFMVGSDWIEDAPGYPKANGFILGAGSGFKVRKYQTSNGATAFWTNDPNY